VRYEVIEVEVEIVGLMKAYEESRQPARGRKVVPARQCRRGRTARVDYPLGLFGGLFAVSTDLV